MAEEEDEAFLTEVEEDRVDQVMGLSPELLNKKETYHLEQKKEM